MNMNNAQSRGKGALKALGLCTIDKEAKRTALKSIFVETHDASRDQFRLVATDGSVLLRIMVANFDLKSAGVVFDKPEDLVGMFINPKNLAVTKPNAEYPKVDKVLSPIADNKGQIPVIGYFTCSRIERIMSALGVFTSGSYDGLARPDGWTSQRSPIVFLLGNARGRTCFDGFLLVMPLNITKIKRRQIAINDNGLYDTNVFGEVDLDLPGPKTFKKGEWDEC